ncbi:ciliary microtubule-associated protein 2 [Apteryx mantelli]|uniref:Ciliary microtubule-associated protein 2 n=1 Tax=Apteryx mantelli TaxID=2696672 RepID=A0ABM4EW09_9AVES
MKRHKHVKETLGPGTYGIKDFLQEKRPSSLRGVCDTRERRFRDVLRDCYPGPGTYGDPYARREESATRSASSRGLTDSWMPQRVLPAAPWKGAELSAGGVKSFLEELASRDSKKKGRFRTVPREPGRPAERISWATLSQRPRDALAAGPGSYDPKPIERSEYFSQPPFWSSAKRFDRKSCCLFAGNEVSEKTRLPGPVKPSCLCPHLPHPYCLCDDGEPHVTFSFQNPVGVGRYNITKHEKYPRKIRYQSLYQCETRRYLSDLERDAYLLERLKPSAKNNWNDLIAALHCPDTSEEITVVF